jgi:septal ring factor EnvC (AmiA/AmiB activator)
MRSVRPPALGPVLAAAMLLLSFPARPQSGPAATAKTGPSPSADAPAQDRNIADFEERLSRIHGQIKELRARLGAEARKETSVLSSLARLNLNKSLVEKELAAQNIGLARALSELAAIQSNIRKIRAGIDRERASIERTLITLYKYGRVDFFQFLLKARDMESYASESKHLAILARSQDRVVADFLASLEELRTAETALESKQRDLAAMARAATLKRQELDTEARKSATLVREIHKNRETFERTLAELSESAEELQKLMAKIVAEGWTLPAAFVPLYERKGKLTWPLEGRVITPFGFEKHPDFDTVIMNKGVEISPAKGKSLILAVHAGKVVYADYFQGYGNLLIVDHGMTYYTLYGHCAEFLAAVGDMVRAGQPVAVVGDTGSLKGECLYFELRFKTKAIDPLQWLKRR